MYIIQELLKDANFLSIYVFVYNNYVFDMCLLAQYSRCAKTWPSSYGLCVTESKQCGNCILTTKLVKTGHHIEQVQINEIKDGLEQKQTNLLLNYHLRDNNKCYRTLILMCQQ